MLTFEEATRRRGAIRAAVLFLLVGMASPGRAIGPQFQVNTTTFGDQYLASPSPSAVSEDGAGGFVVVWKSLVIGSDVGHGIAGQRFTGDGTKVGPEFQVNSYTTGLQFEAAVAPDGSGGFVVVWSSYGSAGSDTDAASIQGQRFSSGGVPAGGQFQVNSTTTGTQRYPKVSENPAGGFVVVWASEASAGTDTDGRSIQGQRFAPGGAPDGSEFQVNSYTTGFQNSPVVTADGGTGFAVVWDSFGSSGTDTSGSSIQARRFTGAGTPVGSDFQINLVTANTQETPAVSRDGTGGFVVVWSDEDNYDNRTIQAQRFSTGWSPVGGQFQVSTTLDANDPVVGSLSSGGFLVAWASGISPSTDTDDASIQAQRFSANGATAGEQFQVNTYTAQSQASPSVGPDGGGNLVVVWSGYDSAGPDMDGTSVQGQRIAGATLDIGVSGKKLLVLDKTALSGSAKVVYVSKDPGVRKGLEGYADGVSATFDLSYDGQAGEFVIPRGEFTGASGWTVSNARVAKFVNRNAPGGPTAVKVAVIKPEKVLKIVAKGLGDGAALDILTQGPPTGSVFTSFCLTSGGETSCHCTEFESCVYRPVAAGSGAKLLCKTPNSADDACVALGEPSGAFVE
jgi:hypothetical protein